MTYTKPVSRFLSFGECKSMRDWPDYLHLGFTAEHVPDLIRMATDKDLLWAKGDSREVWAPLYAWRTLAQLKAAEAIDPLIGLFNVLSDDDWACSELPKVMACLGSNAIGPLTQFLLNTSNQEFARTTAGDSLAKLGELHPEFRERCVVALNACLELQSPNLPALNGLLVGNLLDLNAKESINVIRKAFANNIVDLQVVGDVEDVEIELGLRQQRDTPRPRLWPMPGWMHNPEGDLETLLRHTSSHVKIGRNEPCPCGSGKKYKKCCLNPVNDVTT
jgi:hypothetical protein